MIELLSEERCIGCNLCVSVCPTDVFDEVPGALPVIARVDDCQTCFMCEVVRWMLFTSRREPSS